MKIKSAALLTSVAVLAGAVAHASEARRFTTPLLLAQAIPEEPIYGAQMMTEQERSEHRAALRAAKNEREREQIRRTHHDHIKAAPKSAASRYLMSPRREAQAEGWGLGQAWGPGAVRGVRHRSRF